jgi:hypothetical protein
MSYPSQNEPAIRPRPKPEPSSRLCLNCAGLGSMLPTFGANYTERCGRCSGVGWLKPEPEVSV